MYCTGPVTRINVKIDVLPDDVLLGIFDFYVKTFSLFLYPSRKGWTEAWQSLVHVCRRWRTLVFGSPRCLDLRLLCTPRTPARNTLDVWPALPLEIEGHMDPTSRMDNIIAALGQSNRVCRVSLWSLADRQLEQVLAAMQVPFPELAVLQLSSNGEALAVIPDWFLDGSAPRLRHFTLDGIPFPGLPKLLSSAARLVDLHLFRIPHSGYISPESIVALISVLPRLEWLYLEFQSPQSRPDLETRRSPLTKRSVIPALRSLHFKGVVEYLEDLVTGIDAPQLDRMNINFFNQIDFDTPRLAQLINRTHKLEQSDATVQFYNHSAFVGLSIGTFQIEISCGEPDWQLSSVEQVCNSFWYLLSTVGDLYIEHHYSQLVWNDDAIENTLWLQLLLPFTAVNSLSLSGEFAPGIATALQGLDGDRITEVLPNLRNIFVKGLEPSGPFQEKIGQFVAARQLSNHTITISDWTGHRRSQRKKVT